MDVEAATRHGIYVCNVPDYGTDEVSDHAITLLLAVTRKLVVAAQAFAERNVTPVGLDELLQTSDYVSVHAPLSPDTRHLIGERALGLMKPTAYLVNTARGGLVDADALAKALRAGQIAGAAIDVLETEPIARGSQLLGLENCILTPHAAWYSDEAAAALQRLAGEEAARLLLGEPPRCPVNLLS